MSDKKKDARLTVRLASDVESLVTYWAPKQDMSKNEFVQTAIEYYIKYINGDYDYPTAEQMRLGQLIDEQQHLRERIESLETVVTKGFSSMLQLARGSSYLLDEDTTNE